MCQLGFPSVTPLSGFGHRKATHDCGQQAGTFLGCALRRNPSPTLSSQCFKDRASPRAPVHHPDPAEMRAPCLGGWALASQSCTASTRVCWSSRRGCGRGEQISAGRQKQTRLVFSKGFAEGNRNQGRTLTRGRQFAQTVRDRRRRGLSAPIGGGSGGGAGSVAARAATVHFFQSGGIDRNDLSCKLLLTCHRPHVFYRNNSKQMCELGERAECLHVVMQEPWEVPGPSCSAARTPCPQRGGGSNSS